MAIILHHLNKSRATRPLWLLEELGVKYDVKLYKRDKQTFLAPPELAKVHPSGSSPLVEDDGTVWAESGLILEHLVRKYGADSPLIWKNEEEEATIKYALYAAESNIMISGLMLAVHNVAVQRTPWGLSRFLKLVFAKIDSMYSKKQFEKCLANLSKQIQENGGYYCKGRFTVADVMYRVSLEQFEDILTEELDYDNKWPVLGEWIRRLKSQTKYEEAKAKEQQIEGPGNNKL